MRDRHRPHLVIPAKAGTSINLAEGKSDCPRCGGRYLTAALRCIACTADFTPLGLDYFRSLPAASARRSA